MKRNNKIIEELNSAAPDLSKDIESKVDWRAVKRQNAQSQKSSGKSFWHRPSARALVAACLVVVLALGVALPFILKNPDGGLRTKAQKIKDAYAVSALSGASLLSRIDSDVSPAARMTFLASNAQTPKYLTATAARFAFLASDAATQRPSNISDADVDDIKLSLDMFESVLQNGGISQTVSKNTETEGAYKDYNFVMTISIGGAKSCVMYYNEIATETKTEIDDDGETETEVSTTLEGVMVAGENVYDVTGKKEVETEGDETETEITFTTKSRANPDNYVVISHSIETEKNETEVSYKYKIYENGKKVKETEIEIEEEYGKTAIKVELEKGDDDNEVSCKITKGTKDGTFVVKFENSAKSKIRVEKVENGYKFVYDNGFEETLS